MNEEIKEKDHFVLYVALTATILISVVLVIKGTETDKFAPIKALVAEELNLMDIRIIKHDYE